MAGSAIHLQDGRESEPYRHTLCGLVWRVRSPGTFRYPRVAVTDPSAADCKRCLRVAKKARHR